MDRFSLIANITTCTQSCDPDRPYLAAHSTQHDPLPRAPLLALVHLGFQVAQARTAVVVLDTVGKIIAEKGATKVVTVGHSLGGALALLDGLYLRLHLPSNISLVVRTMGQLRVSAPID